MKSDLLKKINRFFDEHKASGVIVAVISFGLILLFSLTTVYERFELFLYDIRFELKAKYNSIKEWDRLVFMNIDDASISNVEEFPWPRYLYGSGLRALDQAGLTGVTQMTFDIMFPDNSAINLNPEDLDALYALTRPGYKIRRSDLDYFILNNDKLFVDSIKLVHGTIEDPFYTPNNTPIILAYTFSDVPPDSDTLQKQKTPEFIEARKNFLARSSIAVPRSLDKSLKLLSDDTAVNIVYPIPQLMKTADRFGFVNRHTDIDQTLRNVKLVRYFEGRIYFNLALIMIIDFCEVKMENIEIVPGKHIRLKDARNIKEHTVEDLVIPIDKSGMLYVNWTGKNKYGISGSGNNFKEVLNPQTLKKADSLKMLDDKKMSFSNFPFFSILLYDANFLKVEKELDISNQNVINSDPVKNEINRLRTEVIDLSQKYSDSYSTVNQNISKEERLEIWNSLTVKRNELWIATEKYKKELSDRVRQLEKMVKSGRGKRLQALYQEKKSVLLNLDLLNFLDRKLADKIALTSWTGTGTTDLGRTPLMKNYPRVGIYHNIINTIMQQDFINKLGNKYCYMIFILMALVMGMSIQKMDARMSLLTIITSLILVNIVLVFIFIYFNLWVQQLGVNLAVLIPSFAIASVKFLSEESQKKFIKSAFSRYLAPSVIGQILEHPETLELGGESRVITSFFSDVAKFSTISERLEPGQLVKLLNEYLSAMTDIILNYNGTVDKYEGDAIIAFYGAPHPFEDHAVKACMATIDMKRCLREMQELWRKNGKDELFVRMGMNTGEAVVGNMGSKNRMDYTAMGDTINLASRLEGANKFYDTSALISETTYEMAKEHIEARKLDVIRVVGKEQPIVIYELLGKKGSLPQRIYDMMEHFQTGLEYFKKRQWKKALGSFEEGIKLVGDDGPCLTYVKRCKQFIKKAPPANWDGVYRLGSK